MKETAKNKPFNYKSAVSKMSPRGCMKQDELIKCGDINLIHQLIKEKQDEIQSMHTEVFELQTKYKTQTQDREDVILRLNRENDAAMKKHIQLENKIQEYIKKNEKTNRDAQNNFDNQINKIEKDYNEKLEETNVMINERNENLHKMDKVQQDKLKYQLELMAW